MSFDRNNLPDPTAYYEGEALRLTGRGKWRTTSCVFHGGSDSMRINVSSGCWCCMACGVKGGDMLAYHMQAHGVEFVEAAKQIGAWVDDGKPVPTMKPSPLTSRQAIQVLEFESTLLAIEGCRIGNGVIPTADDMARLCKAANRITRLGEMFR